MDKLRTLDLFSGIGGFSLGLERTGGFETVAFCEIEPFCKKVLKKHWPNIPINEDVRTLDATGYGRIDCVTGGYPCQPFSLAGERRGHEDDRHLWPAMCSIIETARPTWVIGENVAGHISMGIDEVLSDLEGLSYAARPFVIPACAVDAPHRRDRVWVVAHTNGERLEGRVYDRKGRRVKTFSETKIWRDISPPYVCRGSDGISSRLDRLRGLGNAVVPQVVERIGNAILASQGKN